MKNKTQFYNDSGELITSPGIIAMLEEELKKPNDLRFPHMTNKFSGSREPEKTQWLLNYFVYRTAQPNPLDEDCKSYYQRINIDNTDDINRFRGALLGCAIGDALGTTLEFKSPGTFKPIVDIIGGGPFNLKAGEWTDDTSMMYCLAHSLVRTKKCDLNDQMELYCRWWLDGVFSVNGKCFDIGMTVRSALTKFKQSGNPLSGDTDPMSAGNGSLMRLVPIPIRYYDSFPETIENSALSSKTTHGAIEAVDACRYFGGLLWGALHGESKSVLLNGIYSPIKGYWEENPLCESVSDLILSEKYKTKTAVEVRGSGYVMHTLEAVLWAFSNSSDFVTGALKVVNLGEDSDTTGAIYGQLAGAFYGERVLPFNWIKKIKEAHVFYLKAEELKDIVISERVK